MDAVLFDLGNTLVSYYRREEFLPVLRLSVAAAAAVVDAHRAGRQAPVDVAAATTAAERLNTERADGRVWPLAQRLTRIFALENDEATPELLTELVTRFLGPIFATARADEHAVPVLIKLRELGKKSAIVSNTPWGSPAAPWRAELDRLGLLEHVDAVAFCVDVGWRKPAPQVFAHALGLLGVAPERAIFVGDDPQWDVVGAERAGLTAILLGPPRLDVPCRSIRRLDELVRLICDDQ